MRVILTWKRAIFPVLSTGARNARSSIGTDKSIFEVHQMRQSDILPGCVDGWGLGKSHYISSYKNFILHWKRRQHVVGFCPTIHIWCLLCRICATLFAEVENALRDRGIVQKAQVKIVEIFRFLSVDPIKSNQTGFVYCDSDEKWYKESKTVRGEYRNLNLTTFLRTLHSLAITIKYLRTWSRGFIQ